MPHYYTNEPGLRHDEHSITFRTGALTIACATDAGVFAKDGLDRGTRLLIEALPPMHGTIADMGCGWGALGIAAALLNPDSRVVMLDVNERAVALANRNAASNGASNAAAWVSDGLSAYDGALDWVLTNPPIRAGKAVVHSFFEQAAIQLNAGGTLMVVIRKVQGADSAKRRIVELLGNVQTVARGNGYHVLSATKGSEHAR